MAIPVLGSGSLVNVLQVGQGIDGTWSGCKSRGDGAVGLGPRSESEMWKAAARQLSRSSPRSRKRLRELHQVQIQQHFEQANIHGSAHCRSCRRWSNSAAASSLRGSQEIGWTPSCTFGSGLETSPQRLSCLEESVFALDAALHNVVNLPWIANQLPPQVVDAAKERFPAVEESGGELGSLGQVEADPGLAGAAETSEKLEPDQRRPLKNETYEQLYERQMHKETEAWTAAVADYKTMMEEMCKKKIAPNLPVVQSLLVSWFEPLRDAILAEQQECKNLVFMKLRGVYGSFLLKLPADVLAVLTMHKLMALCLEQHQRHDSQNLQGAVRVVLASTQIGEAVELEVGIRWAVAANKKSKKQQVNPAETEEEKVETKRKARERKSLSDKVKKLAKLRRYQHVEKLLRNADGPQPWGDVICAKVGARLLQLFLETAVYRAPASECGDDVPEFRPAFKHTSRVYTGKGKKMRTRNYGVIEVDPFIYGELAKSAQWIVMPYMPMIIPPRPWTSFRDGGHLYLKNSLMRTHGSQAQYEAVRRIHRRDARVVYQALDILGKTAWKINKKILAVVETLWENGGRVANLVDRSDVEVPPKPEDVSEEEFTKWKREYMIAKRINAERHSLRCDTNLKLQVARDMAEEKCFYYPHNLDFRGRAYPVHPHLNHLGSDMCRGILEFAKGRALRSSGLRWLKISLASQYGAGFDKLPFDGREAFADDNMEKIFDSAERPLDGERWWAQAEAPFQCLAVCMDIRNALKSGNPENYISYLPIHQDGSCNGLQHYAALGRDKVGGMSVNLIAGERPADVYTGIAKRVQAVIEKDAREDPAVSRSAAHANLLKGQVDRKLVKQTVMTSVYGVTFIGARTQILNRLEERDNLPEGQSLFGPANYAAKVTLGALGEMFKEARCIMKWLGDCARIVAAQNKTVEWVTPLGLPVVQPYRKDGRHIVTTSLQVLALKRESEKQVSAVRQRTAFPPNFVHSLDGTHMMMTAVACGEAGLVFAGVHDSYWTHAGDVEKMNRILREKFVELYSQPVLENLLKGFRKQFPHLQFPDVPGRGDLDLEEVLKSPYFFN